MKLIKTYILFIGFTCVSLLSIGQQDTTWTKIYGGDRDDKANDIINTQDSGYLIIGSTSSFGFDNSQMYFLKLDSLGEIMWSKSHGGTGQESGQSVIQTRDGGYLGVGYTNSWGSGGFDLLLVKLAANGDLEYERYFGGEDWDFANDVIETDSNYFVMAGETQSFGNGGKDAWIVSYNATSDNFDWNKTYGFSNNDVFRAICMYSEEVFFAVGSGKSSNKNDLDVFVSKFNKDGDSLWTSYYGDSLLDSAEDIVQLKNGNLGITGIISNSRDTTNILVLSIDTLGNIIYLDSWGSGFKNSWGKKALSLDSNRMGVLGGAEVDNKTTDFYFGHTYPGGSSGYFQRGATLGSTSVELSSSGTLHNRDGFMFIGTTYSGYSQSYPSIVAFFTKEDGSVDFPQQFVTMEDSVNITGIKPLPSNLKPITWIQSEGLLINPSNLNPVEISIYNTQGQLVYHTILSPSQQLNLSAFQQIKGISIISISSEWGNYHMKFFKQ